LALAGTVGKNETVAGLSDAELFRRLFDQRNDPDAGLLSIAQVCSLVYSFEGEKLDGDDAELTVLGELVGKSPEDVFAAAAELKQRHLLQTRGPWRAVLPHAIANRLASTALERIPRQKLLTALVENAPPRLLLSFSRRLGYLDSSKEARDLAQGWLAPDGLLADVVNFNELRRAMFENIAPVMPGAVLSALESAFANVDYVTLDAHRNFMRLLRSLAYDTEYFVRSVALLVKFARLAGENRSNDEATKIVKSLFYVVLSGTHAPIGMRLKVVEGLLQSNDVVQQKLGVDALEALLKTSNFTSVYNFEFGVRSRDHGYYPPTGKEVSDWYTKVLDFAETFVLMDGPVGESVRQAIGREFRGLWTNVSRVSELERIAHAIAAKGFWREGWIGVRQTRISDGARLPSESLTQLKALEEFLRPKDLVDKVRGVVFGAKGGRSIDLDDLDEVDNDDYAGAMARAAAAVEMLGRDVAADDEAFRMLLPELMDGDNRIIGFGRGLALGTGSRRQIWDAMVAQVATAQEPGVGLLCGFLSGLQTQDRALTDALLDEAVEEQTLVERFPVLQAFSIIDEKAIARLHRALELGRAPINTYYNLAYSGVSDDIPGQDFKRLVLAVSNKAGGHRVAMEILSMRLHSNWTIKKPPVPEVAEAGRALLTAYSFQRTENGHQHEDYELGVIVRASLASDDGRPIARQLCRGLLAAAAGSSVTAFEYNDLMEALLKVHPDDVLDELVSGDEKAQSRSVNLIGEFTRHHKSPMDVVPDTTLIAWCDRDPKARYGFTAAIAPLFDKKSDQSPNGWKDIARTLLLNAPDKETVFKEIAKRLIPEGGVGSLSSQYESRLKLLNQLDLSDMPVLAEPLAKTKDVLQGWADEWRSRETERDLARSGRFE